MARIIVLGGGMVGSAMAMDLKKNHNVSLADMDKKALGKAALNGMSAVPVDFADLHSVQHLVEDFDLVIGAVPGFLGYGVLKTVINAGKDIVDISFFPEDPFDLDELAKEKGVTAVMDCGVAPGMSNILLGYHYEKMKVTDFTFYVGGLPFEREMPFQYKAPFSPVDVLEEYTRIARFRVNGVDVEKEAMTGLETLHFKDLGQIEAFNTDGLRTLLKTMNIPHMKEKTLRWPGHIDVIKNLRDSGLLSSEAVEVNGTMIKPIDLTSTLLFDKWLLTDDDDEFTLMRVIIEGEENGARIKHTYDLFDRRDQVTKTSSMARTTGYSATAAANLILDGHFTQKGLIPPEYLGREEKCFEYLMNYQKARNINYVHTIDNI